jgi:hypothetical protein
MQGAALPRGAHRRVLGSTAWQTSGGEEKVARIWPPNGTHLGRLGGLGRRRGLRLRQKLHLPVHGGAFLLRRALCRVTGDLNAN